MEAQLEAEKNLIALNRRSGNGNLSSRPLSPENLPNTRTVLMARRIREHSSDGGSGDINRRNHPVDAQALLKRLDCHLRHHQAPAASSGLLTSHHQKSNNLLHPGVTVGSVSSSRSSSSRDGSRDDGTSLHLCAGGGDNPSNCCRSTGHSHQIVTSIKHRDDGYYKSNNAIGGKPLLMTSSGISSTLMKAPSGRPCPDGRLVDQAVQLQRSADLIASSALLLPRCL